MTNVIIHNYAISETETTVAVTRPSPEYQGSLDQLANELQFSPYYIVDENILPNPAIPQEAWNINTSGGISVTVDLSKFKQAQKDYFNAIKNNKLNNIFKLYQTAQFLNDTVSMANLVIQKDALLAIDINASIAALNTIDSVLNYQPF